jgi:hypothetical protein
MYLLSHMIVSTTHVTSIAPFIAIVPGLGSWTGPDDFLEHDGFPVEDEVHITPLSSARPISAL